MPLPYSSLLSKLPHKLKLATHDRAELPQGFCSAAFFVTLSQKNYKKGI